VVDFFEPRSYTKFHEVFLSDFVDKAFLRMFDGNRGRGGADKFFHMADGFSRWRILIYLFLGNFLGTND
jgi:hypothetical protein